MVDMIVWDLDGTLADCEHRRHFVDPRKRDDCYEKINPGYMRISEGWFYKDIFKMSYPPLPMKFIPDWKAFYEACDLDRPVEPVIKIFKQMSFPELYEHEIQIWSGRCESVREKTLTWLEKHGILYSQLRMRPIGDSTPDDQLKERWLNELLLNHIKKGRNFGDLTVDFVFDSDPKSIAMWRRRGIFVFNCCQHDEEF